MKLLKSFFTVTFLCAGLMLTQQSCDDCRNVDCQNGGTCDAGDCSCPTGFTGDECETDLCANVTCLNGGVTAPTATDCGCDCSAATGYEGSDCGTASRDKFLGSFAVNETCASGTAMFNSTITASSTDITRILVANVYDEFVAPVIMEVSGNTITIPQQVPDNDGIQISGSGSTSDDGATIEFSYLIVEVGTSNSDNCTSITYTKQ